MAGFGRSLPGRFEDGLNAGDRGQKKGDQASPGALTPGHLVGAELPAPHWEKRGGAGSGKDRKQNG